MASSTADPATSRHGGDLGSATARYGMPEGGWLDLSTGINPIPYPASLPDVAETARLPEPDALNRLLTAAREACRIPEQAMVVASPGSEIAIRLLPIVAPPGPVAVLAPTYSSHGEAWRIADRTVREVAALDQVTGDARIVVLANPNNPDGRILQPEALAALARRLGAHGGLLIVDEAFADVAPEVSLAPHLADLPAVVLRSFGKFYGLAGLRLGFAAGHSPTLNRLAALLGDWPASTAAIAVGRAALSDRAWRDATLHRLRKDAATLRTLLRQHGLGIAGGTDLFVLAESESAAAIHDGLARRGIWTRAFADQPRWLRFGLPADAEGFLRLDRALAAIRTPASPARAE